MEFSSCWFSDPSINQSRAWLAYSVVARKMANTTSTNCCIVIFKMFLSRVDSVVLAVGCQEVTHSWLTSPASWNSCGLNFNKSFQTTMHSCFHLSGVCCLEQPCVSVAMLSLHLSPVFQSIVVLLITRFAIQEFSPMKRQWNCFSQPTFGEDTCWSCWHAEQWNETISSFLFVTHLWSS